MLATNIGGCSWTIYNCFFVQEDKNLKEKEDV